MFLSGKNICFNNPLASNIEVAISDNIINTNGSNIWKLVSAELNM